MIAWVIALSYVNFEIQFLHCGSVFGRGAGSPFTAQELLEKTEDRFQAARMRLPGSTFFVARVDRGLDRDRALGTVASRSAVRFGMDAAIDAGRDWPK